MHSGEITDAVQRKELPHGGQIGDSVVMWLRLLCWRELLVIVIAGLMPMLLYDDVPHWYRWLGIGSVVIVFLLWSLPARGSGLVEDFASVEKRRLLYASYLAIAFTIVSSITIYFVYMPIIISENSFLTSMQSKNWFSSACLVFSGVLSTLRMLPRRVEFSGKKFLFFDYRASLSCLVWSLFTLPVALLIIIGLPMSSVQSPSHTPQAHNATTLTVDWHPSKQTMEVLCSSDSSRHNGR